MISHYPSQSAYKLVSGEMGVGETGVGKQGPVCVSTVENCEITILERIETIIVLVAYCRWWGRVTASVASTAVKLRCLMSPNIPGEDGMGCWKMWGWEMGCHKDRRDVLQTSSVTCNYQFLCC